MTSTRIQVVILAGFLASSCFAQAPPDVPSALKRFVDTQVVLRTGYIESELRFDAVGNLTSKSQPGPLPLYGILLVKSAQVQGASVHFECERVLIYYLENKLEVRAVPTGEKVTIVVESHSEPWSIPLLHRSLSLIFQPTIYLQRLAGYYKALVNGEKRLRAAKRAGEPVAILEGKRVVYGVEEKKLALPPGLNTAWEVVVNEQGLPEVLILKNILNNAAGQMAAPTVRNMRFPPTLKDGVAIAVQMKVFINFSRQ